MKRILLIALIALMAFTATYAQPDPDKAPAPPAFNEEKMQEFAKDMEKWGKEFALYMQEFAKRKAEWADNFAKENPGLFAMKDKMPHHPHKMMGGAMGPMGMQMGKGIGKMMMGVQRLPEMQEELNLTDAQVETLTAMRSEFQKRSIDRFSEMGKIGIDLKQMMENEKSVAQVRPKVDTITSALGDYFIDAYETVIKMKNTLTPEQQKKLDEMK